MVKNGEKNQESNDNVVKKVLISQPKPEGEKSPYFDLAKKHNIELHFYPFIVVDSIPAKEFPRSDCFRVDDPKACSGDTCDHRRHETAMDRSRCC